MSIRHATLALVAAVAALIAGAGCGDKWEPGTAPHTSGFLLECDHAATGCQGCHPAGQPIEALDPACRSCHIEERPESHDPETTNACDDCHVGSCTWDSAGSPHPEGFAQPERHGLEAKLQGPTEGRCVDCHGADLTGGTTPEGATARGCDACHTEEGHADWRTDCVFCHGGTDNLTGAPPTEIDGTSSSGSASFQAHSAHVTDDDGDYRALPCTECHGILYLDALDPTHWWDDSPGHAENLFTRGIAPATSWDGNGTCGTNYCHGQGQREDGQIVDGTGPLDCESCHATEQRWTTMSGLHAAHLETNEGGAIVCNDCHAPVIGQDGVIDSPGRHVNGTRDIGFFEQTMSTTNGGGTCTGVCHNFDHDTLGWGHVPGYEAPELHGRDSNLQVLACNTCHGSDWTGGVAQGCDQCHADEGEPGWRTDCTFCHGGVNDASGAPPQDIDDNTDDATISFTAHPEHTGAGTGKIGHPSYDCVQCHTKPTNALDGGHTIDVTAATAEVTLAGGWSYEGGFDPVSRTCDNMYCHGNGQTPSGTITDGDRALDCDACHATTTGWTAMSGTHDAHLQVSGITCVDCHAPVVDAAGDIVQNDEHVDRDIDLDDAAIGRDANGLCTVTCHNQEHTGFGWSGPHPPGFDDPLMHGQEALLRLQDCTSCHGSNLQGGSGQACDDCHGPNGHADWRSDCVYCHGGAAGDTDGVPPEDIDNTTNEANISFKAHPEHANTAMMDAIACRTCHDGAQNYTDAFSDAGHWWTGDTTAQVAEVRFWGTAAGTTYASKTCNNNYCHGNGQVNGSIVDSATAIDCNGCHSYDSDLGDMSGTHALHLAITGPAVTCADCHSGTANAAGDITTPNKHVNEAVDVDGNATVGWDAATSTCTNTCHGHTHNGMAWEGGHPPGFDDPLVHGQEALFLAQDCFTSGCHGADLRGGASGQGCDSCHDVGWRSNCEFCHGGGSGSPNNSGMPPEDLDNTTNEANITFMAHPEHGDNNMHPLWECDVCHGTGSVSYSDAVTDNGHWLVGDTSPGLAEVTFSGISAGASYNRNTSTCSNLYCHSDGRSNNTGTQADSNNGLSCTGCHGMSPSSGEHNEHDNYDCYECHNNVMNTSSDVITTPNRHVNDTVDTQMRSGNGITWNGNTCSGNCHESHSNENW